MRLFTAPSAKCGSFGRSGSGGTKAERENECECKEPHGVGRVTAATILGEVGDIARFATRNRFATCKLNHALHRIAMSPEQRSASSLL